jgi:hypothetical protein
LQVAIDQFTKDWKSARTNVIEPAFRELIQSLREKGFASQINPVAGVGVALYVALPDSRLARNRGTKAQLVVGFQPNPMTQQVTVSSGYHTRSMRLTDITKQSIEDAVIAAVKKSLTPSNR